MLHTYKHGDKSYKLDDTKLADRARISGLNIMLAMSPEYTTKRAIDTLMNASEPVIGLAVEKALQYPRISDLAIETLFDAYHNNHDDLISSLQSQPFPTMNKQRVYVPAALVPFADVYSNDRGVAVGKGEVLASLLFQSTQHGGRAGQFDIFVDGTPWHIKDHRNCDATLLGKPSDKGDKDDKDKSSTIDWMAADVIQFVNSHKSDKNRNFGTELFVNDIAFEELLLKRYKTRCLRSAAERFENELDDVMRRSILLDQVPGILFLKKDEGGLYFERVDKHDLYFHSVTAETIKVCDVKHRYVNAVMQRSITQELLEKKQRLAQERQQARIAKREEKSLQKLKAKELKKAKSLEEARMFNREWNKATSIDILAQGLGISRDAARSRKLLINNRYPGMFSFKNFRKVGK
jgi:hypothetical protein